MLWGLLFVGYSFFWVLGWDCLLGCVELFLGCRVNGCWRPRTVNVCAGQFFLDGDGARRRMFVSLCFWLVLVVGLWFVC